MYGKIFDSIYDGTLRANWQALVTFQQLIILVDKDGVVDMTPHAIHGRTGIPLDIIEAGLDHLSKPDPYSRSNTEEGRRIILLDAHRPWGWRLVNHEYYNRLRSAEEKRIADRERIAAKRQAEKPNKSDMSQGVAKCSDPSHEVAEVAPITVAVTVPTKPKPSVPQAAPMSAAVRVFRYWQEVMNHPNAKLTPDRRRKIDAALKTYNEGDLLRAIEGCSKTPHNMGQNDRGERYDDIALILRDAAHIERFGRNAVTPPKPTAAINTAVAPKSDSAFIAWARGHGIEAKPGESMDAFRARVTRAVEDGERRKKTA